MHRDHRGHASTGVTKQTNTAGKVAILDFKTRFEEQTTDFGEVMKTIEQFVYPLTILRVLIRPMQMTDYVLIESGKDEKEAFSTAMRPTLFLLLSLAIGAVLVPFTPEEAAALSQSRIGKAITESIVALIFMHMAVFTFFPIAGALIFDIFTPGEPSRNTLRLPFAQQCYILAPFALIVSPCLVLIGAATNGRPSSF